MNERQRTMIFIAIAFAIVMGWTPLMTWLGFAPPPPVASTQPVATTTDAGATTAPIAGTITPIAPPPPAAIKPVENVAIPSEPILIGSAKDADPGFALQLSIDPVGGGLRQVLINQYKERIDSDARYTFQRSYGTPATTPFATRSISIGATKQDISNSVWKVEQTDRKATLSLDLADAAGQPLVRLIKVFELLPRSEGGDAGPRGYDVNFSQTMVNLSPNAGVDISTQIVGPTFPASEQRAGGDRSVTAGYAGKNVVNVHHEAIESFSKETPSKDFTKSKDGEHLQWIGAGGNYFNGILHPDAGWVKTATATWLNTDEIDPLKRHVLLTVDTEPTGVMAPGQSKTVSAHVFFGPRLRSLLKNEYYSKAGVEYYHTLESTGSCSFCTFPWLVNILMTLLGFFHNYIFFDWGLAIIGLVFIVRAILHPITKKSQVNMAQMSKMGPEIERLKKKYGDDKEALNRAMLEFYKNHGATPVLGCLPMFLQMPIWIALYSGLSSTFELRHSPFLYGWTWIKDLAKPDQLIALAPGNEINFLFFHIDGLHVIPLILSVVFYFQFKLQPKPPTMTPEQEQQQTMMKWMTTLLFPFMLYTSPSGLTIYICASTIFGIIESKIIRKHIKEAEDRKASGITFVDGEVIDKNRNDMKKAEPEKLGWFAKLQKWAEEQRAEANKQPGKKKK